MPKLISTKEYRKALGLWLESNISQSNIARLCEIPRSTLNVWTKEWIEWDLKRPVDNSSRRSIDKLLKEE